MKSFLHSVTVTVAQLMAWPGSVMFAEVSQLFESIFVFISKYHLTDFLPSHSTAVSGIPKEHSSRPGLPGAPLGLGLELNEGDLRHLCQAKARHLPKQGY